MINAFEFELCLDLISDLSWSGDTDLGDLDLDDDLDLRVDGKSFSRK